MSKRHLHPLFQKADDLSRQIIGAAIEVHRLKGAGLIESIYERCLLRELELRGIGAVNQRLVRIEYKGLVFDEPDSETPVTRGGNETCLAGGRRLRSSRSEIFCIFLLHKARAVV